MHQVNAGYTLFAELATDRIDAAAALLAAYDADPTRMPFAATTTTHFATVSIIPAQQYGDELLPAKLLVATSFAGPSEVHVRELVRVLNAPLRALLGCCKDFPQGCTDRQLEHYVRAHRHADTFYSGMQHLAPRDVVQHRQLRDEIERYIDARQASPEGFPGDALDVRRAIQNHIRAHPGFTWAQASPRLSAAAWWALHWRTALVFALALPIVVGILLGPFALWVDCHPLRVCSAIASIVFGAVVLAVAGLVLAVRREEAEQTYVARRRPDADVRALAMTQRRPVINELVVAGPVKEGRIRPVFLTVAMWVIARVAEGIPFVPGLRKGINIPTVATARWIAADGGRRLLFLSNFTNAAEPYVRDFIDVRHGAMRINLTFGFGRGYPRTRWVIFDGALADPNGFINVVTEGQHRTNFWYGRYQGMSIDNIKVNRQIREALFAKLDEEEAQTWLHLL